jgi:hypothetical protein
VTLRVEHHQSASRDGALEVPSHPLGRNEIDRRLEDKGVTGHGYEIPPVIGKEGDPGEVLGDVRIGAAEARGQRWTMCS